MRSAKLFLDFLEMRIKSNNTRRHNITLDDNGELAVNLMIGNKCQPVIISGDSLDDNPVELVDKVVSLVEGEQKCERLL